jgi:alkanesulfonate monooxygenase SsuD/methylene tetrahydromethanopterin reductase-like flavin-dependent oxidoreductase (luciferase family)
MRLGILIPSRGIVMHSARRPDVEECWALAREADAAGFDAIWVGDSVVAKPRLDALTTLAYLAAITDRVRLGTAVLLPALRQPVVLAQQIANVDQISRGRLVLGVGVGWSLPSAELEWAACGMDHRTRARALEEQIEVWRALWSGDPVSLEARQASDASGFTLTGHTIGPLPWREDGPPVLITAGNRGTLLEAQLRRFGHLGDGIITTYVMPENCVTIRERAATALEEHGRPNPGFPLCVYTTVRLDDDVTTAERVTDAFLASYYGGSTGAHQHGLMGLGPADVVVAALKQYEAAGVTDLCIRFSGEDQRGQLARFVKDVLPAFV